MKYIVVLGRKNNPRVIDLLEGLNNSGFKKYNTEVKLFDIYGFRSQEDIPSPIAIILALEGIFNFNPQMFEGLRSIAPSIPIFILGSRPKSLELNNCMQLPTNTKEAYEIIKEATLIDNNEKIQNAKPKILVLSSNGMLLNTLKFTLNRKYKVEIPPNPLKADIFLKTHLVNMVLIDYTAIKCSQFDGKTINALKELSSENIPITILLNADELNNFKEIEGISITDYILKPLVVDVLLRKAYEQIGD